MKPQVCVVIPSYRADATIERAIKSALSQPGVVVRVIVVVDDERAESAELVRSLSFDSVRVIQNARNSGAPYSRNVGLAECREPFIMFLDSDDFIAGDLLSGLSEVMIESDATLGFGPWVRLTEAERSVQAYYRESADPRQTFDDWLLLKRFTPPCAVLWRSEFLSSIGGWDERLKRNQDGELVLRALLLGAVPVLSSKGLGIYVNHSSEGRITSQKENYQSLLLVCDKLLSVKSSLHDDHTRVDVIARYLYGVGAAAFRRGDKVFGREALDRARSLGFQGHRGSAVAQLGSGVLGVERYQRLAQKLKAR